MSIRSYRENVRKRATGPNKGTCYPAALEQISPNHIYNPDIYRSYLEYLDWQYTIPARELHLHPDRDIEMLNTLFRPLGLNSWEEAQYHHPRTPAGLARVANSLLFDGFRVTVGLKYRGTGEYNDHVVGLLPVEKDYVTLVSNHVPKCLSGIVSIHEVGKRIAVGSKIPVPKPLPFTTATLVALPPR